MRPLVGDDHPPSRPSEQPKAPTFGLRIAANGEPIVGNVCGIDADGVGYEIRDPEHVTCSAHEAGVVATIIADRSIIQLPATQALAWGLFLFRCAGIADGFPSPADVEKALSSVGSVWLMGGRILAHRWSVNANVDLASKLVETSMERDQLKRNADDLHRKWAEMVTHALDELPPKTIVLNQEGSVPRDAESMAQAIREGTDEGLAFLQQLYVLAFADMERKFSRNPLLLETSTDPRITWKSHGTGKYMHIGPVHLQVYRRGRWVAAATHQHRTAGNSMTYADDLEDEPTAMKAALRMAREFLEQDAASISEALDNLAVAGA